MKGKKKQPPWLEVVPIWRTNFVFLCCNLMTCETSLWWRADEEARGCCTSVVIRHWSVIHDNIARRIRPLCVGQKFVWLWFFSRDAGRECICSFKWSLSWLWSDIANQQGGNWEASRKALEIRAYRWNPEHVFVIVIYCLCHGKKKCASFCLVAAWA